MKKNRELHLRTCVGCREIKPQAELLRVICMNANTYISSKESSIKHIQGRSAYLCPNQHCLDLAQKNRGFERSFKKKVDMVLYTRLMEEINRHE